MRMKWKKKEKKKHRIGFSVSPLSLWLAGVVRKGDLSFFRLRTWWIIGPILSGISMGQVKGWVGKRGASFSRYTHIQALYSPPTARRRCIFMEMVIPTNEDLRVRTYNVGVERRLGLPWWPVTQDQQHQNLLKSFLTVDIRCCQTVVIRTEKIIRNQ